MLRWHHVSRREAWLSAAAVFLVAALIRTWAAVEIVFPKPEDTAYYVGVARNLVDGRGLVSDALWSFQTPPLTFPRPAFEVWLPLPTLVAAPFVALLAGPAPIPLEAAFRASQVTSVLWGALVCVLAWRLAADVAAERGLPPGRARILALGAGLTCAAYMPLILHSALPDSTMPFAALALGACLVATRVVLRPGQARLNDRRLWGLGVLLGLTALTRNEAVWLALTWVVLVVAIPSARLPAPATVARARLVGVAAAASLVVFAPWAARNFAEFGSPLPGQAVANAFSVTGFDIFAWNDPPTLSRYLAVGPARLIEMRIEGIAHNLLNVLLYLGTPVSAIGLLALPWQARDPALRPVVLLGLLTFAITSLAFPVATTWGTFLHAAGPVHVLLVIAALGAVDALLARIGVVRGWTRPVAWLGALLGIAASALFSVVLLPGFAGGSVATQRLYEVLAERMAAIGEPFDPAHPVIHDFPIWLAETERIPTLALPAESPEDVIDLARAFPGTRMLIVGKADHEEWPAVLDTDAPGADCFVELHLGTPPDPDDAAAIEGMRVFRLACLEVGP
ncbi:MAG TPA: hypothetical protein VFK54_12055 [Candidatus Limnocylindrales bacterium]|nr:hypothetical protein [Candidatus Limnocylindrales bacterium]